MARREEELILNAPPGQEAAAAAELRATVATANNAIDQIAAGQPLAGAEQALVAELLEGYAKAFDGGEAAEGPDEAQIVRNGTEGLAALREGRALTGGPAVTADIELQLRRNKARKMAEAYEAHAARAARDDKPAET